MAGLLTLAGEQNEVLRRSLKGETLEPAEECFEVTRSLPNGHVVAVLRTLNKRGLGRLLSTRRHRKRDLVAAIIVARLLKPRLKMARAHELVPETLPSGLSPRS